MMVQRAMPLKLAARSLRRPLKGAQMASCERMRRGDKRPGKSRTFGGLPHLRRIGLPHRERGVTGLAMTIRKKSADWRPLSLAARGAVASFGALALTGCGLSDGA